ncbi:MAG: FAD-dependent monooxygenase [Bacteroidota bacterium]
MRIDIIGGGIGGLTTAIALKKKGFTVKVYEQAKEMKPLGAGIILANNAMQVYQKLGLADTIKTAGNPVSRMEITKANLKPISIVNLKPFERKYGVENIAIHRANLQQILLEELGPNEVKWNSKLADLKKHHEGYTLYFENGTQVASQTILGADGIHSKVREQLFVKREIRDAEQICWRGVTPFDLPEEYQDGLKEAWGKTSRFGFVQIAPRQVYWYALADRTGKPIQKEEIGSLFKHYNGLVQAMIASTPTEAIHEAPITDLYPQAGWYQDDVCLIGDAAHATTPNMGQGACQAIEDAYVLSECMGKYEIPFAFHKFEELRLKKANNVVNMSWRLGKIAHWTQPALVSLRNTLMRLTPSSLSSKQSESLFQLTSV